MVSEFHLIRPYAGLFLLPLLVFAAQTWRATPGMATWGAVCDRHLLPFLIQTKPSFKRQGSLLCLFGSALFMIFSLSGPSWSRFPVPTYQSIQPRVIVLDLSKNMEETDLKPNRFSRAKFKLHDLLKQHQSGQFGLVVYTGEPFVASPLTDDSQTIDALLSALTPDMMPVAGNRLESALKVAAELITAAGYTDGNVLVLTSKAPIPLAIETAQHLKAQGIIVSIIPILSADKPINPLFKQLADSGGGQELRITENADDLNQWLAFSKSHQALRTDARYDIPIWRDQGRWFIIPALLFLLPVFRRGWLQRAAS